MLKKRSKQFPPAKRPSSNRFLILVITLIVLTVLSIRNASWLTSTSLLTFTTEHIKFNAAVEPEGNYTTKHIYRLLHNQPLFQDHERSTHSNISIPSFLTSEPKLPYPVHFVTYASDNMKNTRDRLVRQAERSGWFTSVIGYSPFDLPPAFVEEFDDILRRKRGGGYWIWRFPVLEFMLDRIQEGEFFVFLDAGFVINRNGKDRLIEWITKLEESEYDIVGFEQQTLEHVWTTNRLFDAFEIAKDDESIRNSGQIHGGSMIVRNGPQFKKNLSVIYEILAKDPLLITDDYNEEALLQDEEFRENRHDQSIHSLTQKIYGSYITPIGRGRDDPFLNPRLRYMTEEEVKNWEDSDIANEHPW